MKDKAQYLEALSPKKRALLELLRKEKQQQAAGAPPTLPAITPDLARRHEPFPLTDVQQAYWIGRSAAFELGNVATHVYLELESATLDLERFERAWQRMIERHDMLRVIVLPDGQQQILEHVPAYRIAAADLRGESPQAVTAALEATRREMSHQVLDTTRWPLFDLRASRLDGERIRLHLSFDLLIADAWSFDILGQELARFYADPAIALEPLALSFRDYVLAEIALRESELYRRALAYWRGRLATLPPAPDLPLAQSPAHLAQPRFVRRTASLAPAEWQRLKARAAQTEITTSALLLAAFAEVLALWSKSPRFMINLTIFSRLPLHPQVNDLIGDFTSLILLAVDTSAGDRFVDRARRIQDQLWKDLDHFYVSGVRVLRELAQRTGRAAGAAMPVVFTSTLIQSGARRADPAPALQGEPVYSISQTPQVWLDHQVFELGGGLGFNWDVVEDLFPPGLTQDMFDSYCRLLPRLIDDEPCWQATTLPLVPPAQHEQRLALNATGAPLAPDLLQQLFERQVPQRRDQPAVIAPTRTLTYAKLHRRALRLAHQLRELGAVPGQLVAVVMEKGWEQVVAALAILQAGAAYLPIDPGLPRERLWYVLEHAQAQLALTQPWLDQSLAWPAPVRRLRVSAADDEETEPAPLAATQRPEQLAYVIYTSGSTGVPKGVMIDHRGAVNTILDINRRFEVGPGDRVLALSALSFDLSVYDIFGTLAAGGTIVVPDATATRDPAQWAALMRRERVTIWNSVPALMALLVEYLDGQPHIQLDALRLVLLSGDWIPVRLPERIKRLAPAAQVISLGGATEASIWSILYPIDAIEPAWKSIPYGAPMVNQRFHVLNSALEPCPMWVPGQLYIGGVGLALGYWRDEAKTRASFITHPRTGERLYKTGDLGRYLPDGNIEFLGREDFQVKIQGYRIELGEIEAALAQHPGVRTSAVVALGEAQAGRRLVAYIVPAEGTGLRGQGTGVGSRESEVRSRPSFDDGRWTMDDGVLSDPSSTVHRPSSSNEGSDSSFVLRPSSLASELRAFLVKKLPDYMIPSALVLLDALPLTANGKLDRAALPDPAQPDAVEEGRAPEHPAATDGIARSVAEVLKLDQVAPDANLLMLGAGSVDMIRIANQLERQLGFRPKIDEFYHDPTVLGLSRVYDQHLLQREIAEGPHAPALSQPHVAQGFQLLTDPDERLAFKRRQPGLRPRDDRRRQIALAQDDTDPQVESLYAERRSLRHFAQIALPLADLSRLLGCLRQIRMDGGPKYLYPSAGGLYPVQTYLHLRPDRVAGLAGGCYYYHPADHRLERLSDAAELDREIHEPFINRPVFDEAAFSIFFVAQLSAIAPLYGELARDFCLLEAGAMLQLLMMRAPACGIGLCPIGTVQFERIQHLFQLEASHLLAHSALGGAMPIGQEQGWETFQEAYYNASASTDDREELEF